MLLQGAIGFVMSTPSYTQSVVDKITEAVHKDGTPVALHENFTFTCDICLEAKKSNPDVACQHREYLRPSFHTSGALDTLNAIYSSQEDLEKEIYGTSTNSDQAFLPSELIDEIMKEDPYNFRVSETTGRPVGPSVVYISCDPNGASLGVSGSLYAMIAFAIEGPNVVVSFFLLFFFWFFCFFFCFFLVICCQVIKMQ